MNEKTDGLQLLQFEHEITANCWIALKLYNQFLAEIEEPKRRQETEVFALLRFSLIASSLVGKCFTHGNNERKLALRKRFQVESNSAILKHNARNDIEHYDERIDMHFDTGVLNGVYTRKELEYLGAPNDRYKIGQVFVQDEKRLFTASKKGQLNDTSTCELFTEIERILKWHTPPLKDVFVINP